MIKINSIKVVTEFVDTETGELFKDERVLGEETKKEKKSTSTRSKKPKDEDPIAKVTLLEGKIQLNSAAVELTQFEPEQKIDIQFEKKGRVTTPIMLRKESGNRLTKSYTISCRGSKHDNLAEYGDTFEVLPYEGKEGYFKLKGNLEVESDIVEIPEEISNPEEDNEDLNEIDLSDFNLEL